MIVTCRCCGARASLDGLIESEHAAQVMLTLSRIPQPVTPLALSYVGLFRPAEKALSWRRVATLLADLLAMIEPGTVASKGRDWPAPATAWAEGIEDMLARRDQLTRPMTSHQYLVRVVTSIVDGTRPKAAPGAAPTVAAAPAAERVEAITPEELEKRRRQIVWSENEARKRLRQPPLSAEEIHELYAREGLQ